MTGTRAWDTYARTKGARREVNAAGESTWFNWTQFPDHGPGAEVLSLRPGATVLELGCGKGGNLAHLATLGARAVGVDEEMRARLLAEPRSTVAFAIEPAGETVRLTVVHEAGDVLLGMCRQGWPVIVSGLKTLLETGEPLPGPAG